MARRTMSRRRGGRTDAGAAWISYSDMMAALLLVFVLVLTYSVYQYFAMLQTKTAELDAQQSQLLSKQNELAGALTAIESQKGLLNTQTQTLNEQEATIAAAQAALKEKEDALASAQEELDKAKSLVQTQQTTLSDQQQKLDDLVGVRTKIIRDLSAALASANIKASVDARTGDIMLESTVFFDVGKYTIKDSGQTFLSQFVPLYLSVLLSDNYVDYLGEIIIEGHTDTQGSYLTNLELSQQRALSVATYCLQLPGLTAQQQEKLRQVLTAKGRSYSDPVYAADGTVDMDASRRVEFKFRLKDSEMIDEMRAILSSDDQSAQGTVTPADQATATPVPQPTAQP
ncbi:MAG TPA: OmpA family protein [Candidatus Limiplasma sp.]|nr:OmpA family protein [Candidatus Limiplasma sp.]HPR77648.1 OmpA family protein [Candidatus Limiplasma sp.]